MKIRTSTLGEVGDPSAPPGSRPWAIALKQQIREEYRDRETAAEHLGIRVSLFMRHEGWRVLEDRKGQPFASWDAFCRTPPPFGLGVSPDAVAVEVERRATLRAGPGRPPKGEENVGNTDISMREERGTAAYTQARLEREARKGDSRAAELVARVEAGTLSANAAAIEAGFRKRTITVPLDPERAARVLLKHFDPGQLAELISLLERA